MQKLWVFKMRMTTESGLPAKCGQFHKVSYFRFAQDMKSLVGPARPDDEIQVIWENIQLPTRATAGSAGYDIRAPYPITLAPGEEALIPTGLCVEIDDGWFLGVLPRSGLGFKYRLQLDNTLGVIDSDFIDSANEGHIMLKMINDNREGKTFHVDAGKGIAQAIFFPFGITYDDAAEGERHGGFGSTGT